jgi:chromosome segregation ATPase
MSNEQSTVTYSLEQVLTRLENKIDSRFEQIDRKFEQLENKIDNRFEQIDRKFEQLEQKIDHLQQDVTNLKVGQVRLEEDYKNLREDVQELKGSSKAQIWTLIGILLTAIASFSIAVVRFVFLGNP